MKLKRLGPSTTELTLKDGTRVLFSYDTPVAAWVKANPGEVSEYLKSEEFHSRTTSAHVSRWLAGARARSVPAAEIAALVAEAA